MTKVPPRCSARGLGSRASSRHAWRLRAVRHSQGKAGPLGALTATASGALELAASKAASLEAAHIPPPLTVQEGIMRLKKLLEAGAITESEFEAKKTELLHRL